MLVLAYRTIGVANPREADDGEFGSYNNGGRWLGHLVVIADGVLLDPTIAQINSNKFGIDIDPSYLSAHVYVEFLQGKQWLIVESGETTVCYKAYPWMKSFTASRSWNDDDFRKALRNVGKEVARKFKGKPKEELHRRRK